MNSSERIERATIVLLSVVIIGAFVCLWLFRPAGLPKAERQEVNLGVIFIILTLVSSLIFAPLFARLQGWSFKRLGIIEPESKEQSQDEKDAP